MARARELQIGGPHRTARRPMAQSGNPHGNGRSLLELEDPMRIHLAPLIALAFAAGAATAQTANPQAPANAAQPRSSEGFFRPTDLPLQPLPQPGAPVVAAQP